MRVGRELDMIDLIIQLVGAEIMSTQIDKQFRHVVELGYQFTYILIILRCLQEGLVYIVKQSVCHVVLLPLQS